MDSRKAGRPVTVWALISMLAFLALNALAAGGAFIAAPDGRLIRMPISSLDRSPFSNFLVPGILLFVFVGLLPAIVSYGLWKQPDWTWPNIFNPINGTHWSWAGSLATAVALIVWITVQVQWIEFGVLHAICLAWGALIVLITLLPGVRRHCRR